MLRFYNYWEIPFTHDEFSTLFRLRFDSFSKLIDEGVKIDGHPAGVQVFLYYWTRVFGEQEWVVKLPFTILGLASVYLIYWIGKKWFNETVGLLSAAFLASLQFPVMYSQIARPYISGMFFSLLMIYYWSNLMMNPQNRFYRNYILFIISTSLCTYNHHFSLLFAVIVSISGLFLIQKKYLLRYLISGLVVFVLYIPHLNIFFYQLKVGGVEGWLAKPQNDFLIQFVYYILNYSVFVVVLVLSLILFGFLNIKKHIVPAKYVVLSSIWFLLPFLIGFFYSKYVNAVLQYSVLLFSFPLLFFILFGFIKNQNTKINLILVSLILITNILTLIYGRKHYEIFYKSVYEHILTDYESLKNDSTNTVFIVHSHQKISDYYIAKHHIDTNFVNYPEKFKNLKDFKKYLDEISPSKDKLYLGCLSSVAPNMIPLIQDYFPKISVQNDYFGGTSYVFTKGIDSSNKTINTLDFETAISKNWKLVDSATIIPNTSPDGGNAYAITGNVEWGPTFEIPLEDVISNKNNFIDIGIDAMTHENFDGVTLVASLIANSEQIYWSGTDFNDLITSDGISGSWQKFHHSMKLSDINLNYDNIVLKIYIWNRNKKNFQINNFRIRLREGNTRIYGLYNKL